jgi:hypothetical protein
VATPIRRCSARGLIAAAILFLVSTGFAAKSVAALVNFAGNSDKRNLSAYGFAPDPAYLSRFVVDQGLDRPSIVCCNASTRARLTVSLAALESAIKGNELAHIDVAKKNSLQVARERLICNPLDENVCLPFAKIIRSYGQTTTSIDALRLSYWSAPSWVVDARLPFATQPYLTGVAGLEAEHFEDLRRFASYEPIAQVAAIYAATAPSFQALLHSLIAAQPQSREKEIVTAIDRLELFFDAR